LRLSERFEVVYYLLLPKFIQECNRLLTDGAADSTTCALHVVSLNNAATRTVRKLLGKEQWPLNNSPKLNGMEMSFLGIDARSYFETFIRSPKQLMN